MKRILAILLCLCLTLGVAACKPDNITYPTVIQTPGQSAEVTDSDPTDKETPTEEEPLPEEEPAADETAAELPNETTEETPAAEVPHSNPLAAETFTPSKGVPGTLSLSGKVLPGSAAVSPLTNRTIVIYTADGTPAFSYTNEKGNAVTEWQWMEQLAEEQGFILKYSIKNKAVSLKAQRTALYAGKKLSLVQMDADELGVGMTLCRSATDYIDEAVSSFGISGAILNASNQTLFAPVGNIKALWYNPALLPQETDPAAMAAANQWTVEQFKAIYNDSVSKSALPLEMEDPLAWATLSGRSPLTLLDGKLDSNLYARVTRDAFSVLRTMNEELPDFTPVPDTVYSLANNNVTMAYTAIPTAAKEVTLTFAPLPALETETPGTVTYTGTYFGLPKYETDEESAKAALTFAELWCNRYTEVLAGKLQALGIKGSTYETYTSMAENQGHLILRQPEIEEAAATYLQGLTDPLIDMDEAYSVAQSKIENIITVQNLYY
ncbi:MAG: hypothetical protein IJ333_04950 [Clostridia bacterium]|nr:hypothetical protein [Clostridia bacterium]